MVDRVVLLSLVSFDRWVPAAEIAVQLGTGEAQIRTVLADLIAAGEPIDAGAAGYRRYTETPVSPVTVSRGARPVLTSTSNKDRIKAPTVDNVEVVALALTAPPTSPAPVVTTEARRKPETHVTHAASEFGTRLRSLRVRIGLSQNQLARMAGVDPAYVNRLERAPTESATLPSRKVVLALWSALEASADDRERLLVAAGHCPEVIVQAGGWDAYREQFRAALDDAVLALERAFKGQPVMPAPYRRPA